MLAAAVLLARGRAGSVEEAEVMVRAARPGIGLQPAQRRLLDLLITTPPEKEGQSR
jgi:protein-tyrosine phosphatase